MPQTPPGSPKAARKTEEEKNLSSSQESVEERLEDDSHHSEEENLEDGFQHGEENVEQKTTASEETPQNPQPRTAPTLFGFAPRVQRMVLFVCPEGHMHMIPAEMLPIIQLASLLNAISSELEDENELEENVGQEAQTEERQEESVDQEVSESKSHDEGSDEESEEERNESVRCYQM